MVRKKEIRQNVACILGNNNGWRKNSPGVVLDLFPNRCTHGAVMVSSFRTPHWMMPSRQESQSPARSHGYIDGRWPAGQSPLVAPASTCTKESAPGSSNRRQYRHLPQLRPRRSGKIRPRRSSHGFPEHARVLVVSLPCFSPSSNRVPDVFLSLPSDGLTHSSSSWKRAPGALVAAPICFVPACPDAKLRSVRPRLYLNTAGSRDWEPRIGARRRQSSATQANSGAAPVPVQHVIVNLHHPTGCNNQLKLVSL
jgi:hypothetical protein